MTIIIHLKPKIKIIYNNQIIQTRIKIQIIHLIITINLIQINQTNLTIIYQIIYQIINLIINLIITIQITTIQIITII